MDRQRKAGDRKESDPRWGVLVHGNRVLAAAVFKRVGLENCRSQLLTLANSCLVSGWGAVCADVHSKMVATIESKYQGKFLAVIFKNPSMSKVVFDSSAI